MKALEKIKESSQTIVKICQKERLSRADKERLFKLQGDIFSQIDTLTECEICGRVSDLIASITIANTTANLCSQCGIVALTDGQIKKTSRRSSRKTSTDNRATKNKKVNNLYYSGHFTVPGPGLPPAVISGKIVSNQIGKDLMS